MGKNLIHSQSNDLNIVDLEKYDIPNLIDLINDRVRSIMLTLNKKIRTIYK